MKFAEIPGLEHTKLTLVNSVKNNHVAHAQMFMGREGSGNLAMALAYAAFVNCENKQENDSCGECPSCSKISKLIHPDLHFVYPTYSLAGGAGEKEKKQKWVSDEWRKFLTNSPYATLQNWAVTIEAENKQCIISVEESRKIVKSISLKAFEAEYKILIMWLPEEMNQSAANSLLKILEEPPQKTLFLLVSNNSDKNLTTILSRCQKVNIPSFNEDEIATHVINKFGLESEKAKNIARFAEGNLNEALRLSLEMNEEGEDLFKEWMRHCFKADFISLTQLAEEFQRLPKAGQKSLIQYGINLLRDILMFHAKSDELLKVSESQKGFVEKFSEVIQAEKIPDFTQLFNESFYHLERNANPKITFMDLSIDIARKMRA